MKFKIKSNDQRQIPLNMDSINIYASKWLPGTVFEIEFVRRVKKKSDPMRKYFFGCVLPIFLNAYGYDPDEALILHERLKVTFFGVQPDSHGVYRPKDIPSVFGDNSEIPIDKKQEYVEWIKRKSAEEGHYTPDPGE